VGHASPSAPRKKLKLSIAITSRPSASVLPVLAGERVDKEKSTSVRRLALALGNLDPKKMPEVIALGGAFLQQTVNSPVDGHWRATVPPP
jgi:hypothetical protein